MAAKADGGMGCAVVAIPLTFFLLWLTYRLWFVQFFPIP